MDKPLLIKIDNLSREMKFVGVVPMAQYRVVAQFFLSPKYSPDETVTMHVVFNYLDNKYYITSTIQPNTYTCIPDNYKIGDSLSWFYNTQCAPFWNQELVFTEPLFTVHKRNGEKIYPIKTLNKHASTQLLKAQWHELSLNPIVGSLCF
jgi:hypothetical protein